MGLGIVGAVGGILPAILDRLVPSSSGSDPTPIPSPAPTQADSGGMSGSGSGATAPAPAQADEAPVPPVSLTSLYVDNRADPASSASWVTVDPLTGLVQDDGESEASWQSRSAILAQAAYGLVAQAQLQRQSVLDLIDPRGQGQSGSAGDIA